MTKNSEYIWIELGRPSNCGLSDCYGNVTICDQCNDLEVVQVFFPPESIRLNDICSKVLWLSLLAMHAGPRSRSRSRRRKMSTECAGGGGCSFMGAESKPSSSGWSRGVLELPKLPMLTQKPVPKTQKRGPQGIDIVVVVVAQFSLHRNDDGEKKKQRKRAEFVRKGKQK